jgi:hypothetical protein
VQAIVTVVSLGPSDGAPAEASVAVPEDPGLIGAMGDGGGVDAVHAGAVIIATRAGAVALEDPC